MITMMMHMSWAMPIPMGMDPSSAKVSNWLIISVTFGNSENVMVKIYSEPLSRPTRKEWQPTRL